MIKVLKGLGIQGTYPNIIKAIYNKPAGNITRNREKHKAFPLKIGRRLVCLLSAYLLSPVLEVITRATRQLKEEIKGGYK